VKKYKVLLFIFALLLSFNILASPFELNPNGMSHVYFPIDDDKSKWQVVNGSPYHKGSDAYADDWNLKSGYTVGGQVDNCDRDKGAKVISSFAGKVIHADIQGNIGAYGKEVIIRSSSNPSFAMRYSHLDNVYVSEDDDVNLGASLGTVGDTGLGSAGCAHLHLVLYKNLNNTALSRLKKGYSPKSLSGGADVFAAKFYSDATSGSSPNISSAGIFDGAGSLINSPQDCYGCNKDIAVMHPHPGTGSTVVFQWLYNGSECEFLDLTADKNIEVIVKSKAWSEHLTQKAFKTTLSSSPVSLKQAGSWTTFAITSTSSISNETWITAQCRKPNNTFHNGSTQAVAKDLVDATHDYYWTGTGSIISQANREGYGVGYDVAATFSSKKSLTSFQWLSTSSCSKLEISDGSSAYHNANVSIKVWNEREFNQVCSSLPCSISKSSNFYVIKVKSDANEFNGGTIKASCK